MQGIAVEYYHLHNLNDFQIEYRNIQLHQGLLLEENRGKWCITCSKESSKKKCHRPIEEHAKIGLELGIFKADFVGQPFKEGHPRYQTTLSKRKEKLRLSEGANVQTNPKTTKSVNDTNDAETPAVSKA